MSFEPGSYGATYFERVRRLTLEQLLKADKANDAMLAETAEDEVARMTRSTALAFAIESASRRELWAARVRFGLSRIGPDVEGQLVDLLVNGVGQCVWHAAAMLGGTPCMCGRCNGRVVPYPEGFSPRSEAVKP